MKAPSLLPPRLPLTPGQVQGPYFLNDAPLRSRLYPKSAKGSLIRVSGQVLSSELKPISNAQVHVWLASPEGRYDNQGPDDEPMNIPPAQQVFRGRLVTDFRGNYSFTCLRPGNYFDSGWNLWRPAHIHVQVEAPGYKTLVTQLYFPDDPQNFSDIPGDDFFQPELALQLSPADQRPGMTQSGFFNFVLEVA